ncbi:MAG: 3-dehydroquinate synthase [Bacteroidota bacterium]
MKTSIVSLRELALEHYRIYVGDIWPSFRKWLSKRAYSQILVIVDEHTEKDCLPIFLRESALVNPMIISIPAGESYKNIQTCTQIWSEMMQAGADRQSLCINLGGGVIGDMGGFCASTFKRGMDFVQMPTTLLSQVDASIGGKLGIDFEEVKNSVGLFCDPQAVFIDPVFLNTLSEAEIRSGMAEMFKHSLIADAEQWMNLQNIQDLRTAPWVSLLVPSLQIKQGIVEEDPYERNIRKALNFGHTIGHAVEGWGLANNRPLLHGEAVAIGMIAEAYLSHLLLALPESDLHQISDFLCSYYPAYAIDRAIFPDLIDWMKKDKKNERQQINFSLISSIGQYAINQHATKEQIEAALQYYCDYSTK